MDKNIKLHTQWITRSENQYADELSRHTDPDDWAVSSEIYQHFNSTWGPYSIDRFATHCNTQCNRFNSRIWYRCLYTEVE